MTQETQKIIKQNFANIEESKLKTLEARLTGPSSNGLLPLNNEENFDTKNSSN